MKDNQEDIQYRILPDDYGWKLEVGMQRSLHGKPTGFSWKNDGYFNRLPQALNYLLDRHLRDHTSSGSTQELISLLAQAKETVLEAAEAILKRNAY